MNQDYANLIPKFSLFEGLTIQEAEMLIEHGSINQLDAGEIVFLEGAAADSVLLVLEGELEVFVTRNKGNAVLATQEPGAVVGELAVLCGTQRAASVRAVYASTVLKWQAENFREMLIRHTFMSERIFRQALSGLIEKEKSLLESLTRW